MELQYVFSCAHPCFAWAVADGMHEWQADGFFTFQNQRNETNPGGETGPWILFYDHEPTVTECQLVYRDYMNSGSL